MNYRSFLHECRKWSKKCKGTSTPRRRKRVCTGRTRENSVMVSTNVTGNQSTLDESTMSNQPNLRVSVPVHTQHVVHTTVTTTTSSNSQRNPLQIGQIRGPQDRGGANTQVVFSTCQILHPGQHTAIRAATNDNIRVITAVPTGSATAHKITARDNATSHR